VGRGAPRGDALDAAQPRAPGLVPGIQIQNLARSLRLGTLPRSNLVIAGDWDVRGAETFNASVNLQRVSGDLRVGEPRVPPAPFAPGGEGDGERRARASHADIAGERIGRVQGEGAATIVRRHERMGARAGGAGAGEDRRGARQPREPRGMARPRTRSSAAA
jgi:hypothetical protein